MKKKYLVRITKSRIENFKNVQCGEIKYMNYTEVEKNAKLVKSDVVGIYGQNGSGKTAMVEALDILKHILSGQTIPYDVFGGLLSDDSVAKIATVFFVECAEQKYKAEYTFELKKCEKEKKLQIFSEQLTYWTRGANWKGKRSLKIANPFYDTDAILNNEQVEIETNKYTTFESMRFLKNIPNMAIYCAQTNVSLFFNAFLEKNFFDLTEEKEEEYILAEIVRALFDFGLMYFKVVKVNQLGAINNNILIPVNIHEETQERVMHGCLPMFMNGHGEVPEEIYKQLSLAIESINIALKAIIPNLKIALSPVREEMDQDGKKMIQVDVYSIRDGKKFLTKYESEGIKRIISLLNYLISLYNYPEICLVVDELDSGIFEYLLGELLGVIHEDAKGQLIFTSHNLRILEKLETKNIVCSTTNPQNRYIRLTGVEKNHNRRDFFIRAIVLGGQKESLYDDSDLQSISYAFRAACQNKGEDEKKIYSPFEEFLKKNKQETHK